MGKTVVLILDGEPFFRTGICQTPAHQPEELVDAIKKASKQGQKGELKA